MFHREGAVGGAATIILVQPDISEEFIDRMIEYQRVICHVHMAVIVDPLRENNFCM